MKALENGSLIKLASWVFAYASVGTLEGYCPAHAPAARAKGEPECWAIYAGSAITNSPAYYAAEKAKVASAVVVAEGEVVSIEGKPYAVKVVKGNAGSFPVNSDPIKFLPGAPA